MTMAGPPIKKRKLAYPQADAGGEIIDQQPHRFSDDAPSNSSDHTSLGPKSQSLPPLPVQGHHTAADRYSNAHHTNLFSLEIEELLTKVRPHHSQPARVEDLLEKLMRAIESIPSREALPVSEAIHVQHTSHGVSIPFPEPRPAHDAKYKLAYSKPSNMIVIGSYDRNTTIRSGRQPSVDLAVEMPSHLFQDKDYLNYRYFHKRAYYLACIATGIQGDPTCNVNLEFTFQNGVSLQPSLLVNSGTAGDDDDFRKTKCQIQIILMTKPGVFPCAKTLPTRNCIRSGDWSTEKDSIEMPTPFYNATIRSECSYLAYIKYLDSVSVHSGAFNDACILGSVWLRQRGYDSHLASGGFGPFEWSCTTALLMQGTARNGIPILSKEYTSYQMFKAMLQFLAARDLVHNPAFISSDSFQYDKLKTPFLFDGARGLNVLFKMSTWSYNSLRYAAKHTLKLLADCVEDAFESCFIVRVDTQLFKYDYVARFLIGDKQTIETPTHDALDKSTCLSYQIYQLLCRGLSDRVNLIDIKRSRRKPWAINVSAPLDSCSSEIRVGLLVDTGNIERGIDKGPSAEEMEKAAEFRLFWGEKAELRRFRDGSILESLVWSSAEDKPSVLHQIIAYLVQRHFKKVVESMDIVCENQAKRNNTRNSSQHSPATFEILEKQIRSLEGLPLQVRQISASDSQLHDSASQTSFTRGTGDWLRPAHVCVQFEGSNRWPDDYAAVQRTKIALLLKMGEILEASKTDLVTKLGLESTSHALADIAFLDIIYSSGAAFRIRIHHEREQSLLARELKNTPKSATAIEAAAYALSEYKRHFCQAPLHTQAVRTLGTRFPPLPASIRLLKRWRDCHLLSNHISDELIELLSIRTFIHPGPYSVPGSSMAGFLRTLLFISKWDWRTEPVIVDPNNEMRTTDLDAIKMRFQAWRKLDPAMNRMVLFAASNEDRDGITWTERRPSKVVAARFTDLARAAVGFVKEQDLNVQAEILFTPNLYEYDFIIHLDKRMANGKQRRASKTRFKNLQIGATSDSDLVGFDPVELLLEDLRDLCGSSVLLFYNAHLGDIVCGLWTPTTGPRPWKVSSDFSTVPSYGGGENLGRVAINKLGTLNDIARLGGDVIASIEMKR